MDPSLVLHRLPGLRTRSSVFGEAVAFIIANTVIGAPFLMPVVLLWLWRRARASESRDEDRSIASRIRHWAGFYAVLAVVFTLAVVPVKRRPRLMQAWFWQRFLEYFSPRIAYHNGVPLPPGQYIYCMMPHGLYPFGQANTAISKMVSLFPNTRVAVAPVGLWIPVVRHLMGWIGCVTVDRPSMARALKAGLSLSVVPGGIAEMVRTDSKMERLVLNSRKGLVQFALQNGVPLVPVYIFGTSTLWSQVTVPACVERLSRWLGVSLLLPYGRFGTLAPRKHRLLYAIGRPISGATSCGNPSSEEVDATHALLVSAVREMYDFYKGPYGWHNRPLSIE